MLEALRNTLGKSFVPGSILNRCLISLPSHVKLEQGSIKSWTNCEDECDMYLTTPVATSIKQPTKSPVDGGLPEGSLLT